MKVNYNLRALQRNLNPLVLAGLLRCVNLTDRQRFVIRKRHGLDGGAKLSFAQIGAQSNPPVSGNAARTVYAAGIRHVLDNRWGLPTVACLRISHPQGEWGDEVQQYVYISGRSEIDEREKMCASRSDSHALDDLHHLPPSRVAVARDLLEQVSRI